MGGGGQETQSTQQSTSVQQLPPWVNEAAQQNYAFAQNVANRPLQQYQGQLVADVAPQTQQSWDLAANSGQAGQPEYQGSEAAFLNAAGYNPAQVKPGALSSTNLQPYMNPFTKDIIDTTLPLMAQQLAQAQNSNNVGAAGQKAFGGSRLGVQQGVTNAQGALNMAQMAEQLNQGNFAQAQQAATGDITRDMAAQQANQAAAQAAITSQLQAGQGLAGLGQQAQQNQRQGFLELASAGSQEQQQAQNQINAQQNKFNQAFQYPTQQLGTLLEALGMTPYGMAQSGTTNTQQQTTQDNTMASIFGALQMGGSLLGGGGPLAGLMGSDRNLKTDIRRVGMHPLGMPLYSYRYKGDPKSYPKVTGPMAEDVLKVAPHAVKPVGLDPSGTPRLGVDMNVLGAMSPPGPAGQVGALGRTLRKPSLRPIPRMPMPKLTGALSRG